MNDNIQDIEDQVVKILEGQGVLATLRASLRASVYCAIHEESNEILQPPKQFEILQSNKNFNLSLILVRELLKKAGLNKTLSVFDHESSNSSGRNLNVDNEELCKLFPMIQPPVNDTIPFMFGLLESKTMGSSHDGEAKEEHHHHSHHNHHSNHHKHHHHHHGHGQHSSISPHGQHASEWSPEQYHEQPSISIPILSSPIKDTNEMKDSDDIQPFRDDSKEEEVMSMDVKDVNNIDTPPSPPKEHHHHHHHKENEVGESDNTIGSDNSSDIGFVEEELGDAPDDSFEKDESLNVSSTSVVPPIPPFKEEEEEEVSPSTPPSSPPLSPNKQRNSSFSFEEKNEEEIIEVEETSLSESYADIHKKSLKKADNLSPKVDLSPFPVPISSDDHVAEEGDEHENEKEKEEEDWDLEVSLRVSDASSADMEILYDVVEDVEPNIPDSSSSLPTTTTTLHSPSNLKPLNFHHGSSVSSSSLSPTHSIGNNGVYETKDIEHDDDVEEDDYDFEDNQVNHYIPSVVPSNEEKEEEEEDGKDDTTPFDKQSETSMNKEEHHDEKEEDDDEDEKEQEEDEDENETLDSEEDDYGDDDYEDDFDDDGVDKSELESSMVEEDIEVAVEDDEDDDYF